MKPPSKKNFRSNRLNILLTAFLFDLCCTRVKHKFDAHTTLFDLMTAQTTIIAVIYMKLQARNLNEKKKHCSERGH